MASIDPLGWTGSTIDGQFTVEAVAGVGGFGVVYRGTHLGLDVPVAIKCLRAPRELSLEERPRFLAKFRAEARILHQLSRQTTSIVQALAVGAATAPVGAWTPYIVMEWLEGETLESDLAARSASGLPPRGYEQALRMLDPVADALATAHANNITHRDVKPANIFLTRSRGEPAIKVLDFGIAKIFAAPPSVDRPLDSTEQGDRALTPLYGAPEQFLFKHGVTGPWTDVFAMALIVIEVASGRRALSGQTMVEVFQSSSEAHRRSGLLDNVVPNDSAAAQVLRRALAVQPEARFPSVGALWTALLQARGGASSSSSPLTVTATALAPDLVLAPTAALDKPRLSAEPVKPPATRPPTAPEGLLATGENRVCTVLSVDIPGISDLSSRLAPDELQGVLDGVLADVDACVRSMGGAFQGLAGERLSAAFGVTHATDKDAERAVLTASRVQAVIERVRLPRAARAIRLTTRIGIATGRVYVSARGGSQRAETTLVGEPVNIAEELQRRAPLGAIVIERGTYRHVASRFRLQPLAPIEIAGRPEPILSFRVVHAVAPPWLSAPRGFHGIVTKFVGRAVEKQQIVQAIEAVAVERTSHLLALVGVSGVGCTRLLIEAASDVALQSAGFLMLTSQCSPISQGRSYGLAAALLRARFGIAGDDAPVVIRKKLRRGLRWLRIMRGKEARGAAPGERGAESFLRSADELSPEEIGAAIEQVERILMPEPDGLALSAPSLLNEIGLAAKQRISAALVRLARFAAKRAPILVVCDDIQWADEASLNVLEILIRLEERLPLLVLCSANPDIFARRPAWESADEGLEIVTVGPLARRHIEEMIRDRLQRLGTIPAELVRVLADRAEGNALILEETLHLLVDARVLDAPESGAWAFHDERLGALTLPTTIQGVVQSRIDRLPPEARELLVQAAIVGKIFWQGAIERLRSETNTGTARSVEPILSLLKEQQLIRRHEPPLVAGEREYVFVETATQEVAHEMLGVRIRRSLHAIVADWLSSRLTSPSGAPLLALHFDRAGAPARAAAEYVRAAAHAASLGENAEAMNHLERARVIHDDARDDGADVGGAPWTGEERRVASPRDRIELRLAIGDALRRAGKLDEAERAYVQARDHVLRVERRGGKALRPSAALLWDARIDARIALIFKVRGSSKDAIVLIQRAIEGATKAEAAQETPPMYALLAFLLRRDRRPEESWTAARSGLRICRSTLHQDASWQETVGQLMLGIAQALMGRGKLVRAERAYRQTARMVSGTTHPHLVGAALNGVAGMRLRRGDARGSRDFLLRSMRFKERAGDLHQLVVGYSNLAEIELQLRETSAALEHARRAVRLGEQIHAGSDLADMYANLAEAELAAGGLSAALAAARRALPIAESQGRIYLGRVGVTLARVIASAAQGDRADAALWPTATEAAGELSASIARSFDDSELRAKAEECRALLSAAGISI